MSEIHHGRAYLIHLFESAAKDDLNHPREDPEPRLLKAYEYAFQNRTAGFALDPVGQEKTPNSRLEVPLNLALSAYHAWSNPKPDDLKDGKVIVEYQWKIEGDLSVVTSIRLPSAYSVY